MVRHSEQLGEFATALALAQGEFESVAKGAENPFFKSKYAALPDVVKAASPILSKHGLSVAQFPGHDESGHNLTTMVLHSSGQFIAETMRLKPVKDDPQAQGSAITYGRRYSYMAALGLVADEDDDGNAGSAGKPSKSKPARQESRARSEKQAASPAPKSAAPASLPQARVEELRALVAQAGWDAAKLTWGLLAVGVEDVEDLKTAIPALTSEQADALKTALDEAIGEAA